MKFQLFYDPRYDNDALIRLPHSGMVNKQEEYDFLVPSRVRGLIAYMLCQALFSSANYYLHFFNLRLTLEVLKRRKTQISVKENQRRKVSKTLLSFLKNAVLLFLCESTNANKDCKRHKFSPFQVS